MFDFNDLPFFSNHTHRINVENRAITPIEFAIPFMHGWGDIYAKDAPLGSSAKLENCSTEFEYHVMNQGVVKTVVNYMSEYFNCEADIETVVKARNKQTLIDGAAYAEALCQDVNLIAEVLDDGAPMISDAASCFQTKVLRLFQMDPLFDKLLKVSPCYADMKMTFDHDIRQSLAEGFVGVKCHVFEVLSCHPHVIEEDAAQVAFVKARAGEKAAWDTVYLAIFEHLLIMTQELNFTAHIHTGCTGNPANGLVFNCDPINLCAFMVDHRFFAARIVLLHGSFPDVRHAALLAHSYPNVWVDLGWTLPWTSLNFAQCMEETLGIAPHSKILLGTGQHDHAEISWAAAKVAKSSLAYIMEKSVKLGFISQRQAQESAEMILYKNALRLYNL